VAEELTTDEQAIWATQARVSDSTAMENPAHAFTRGRRRTSSRTCGIARPKRYGVRRRGLNVPIG